jgi:hypothetical protein
VTTAPEGRGGYRQPNNPAPVSGPGMLSKRTDGGAIDGMTQPVQDYTGGSYGNNKSMRQQQEGADLFAEPATPEPRVTPLNAPTEFPDQPDSHGASWDVNTPGIDVTGVKNLQPMSQSNLIYRAMQNDPTGKYEAIYNKLNLG